MTMNCVVQMVDQWKCVKFCFLPGSLLEVLTVANVQHASVKIGSCTKPKFRTCQVKVRSRGDQILRFGKVTQWVMSCIWNQVVAVSNSVWCSVEP